MKTVWKRLSALVLALTMVLSLLSASVWADGEKLTITVGSATAKAGEYAEITVSVANNGEPGIAGMALEFVLPEGVSMVASDGLNSPNPFVNMADSIFKDGILLPNDDGKTVSLLSGDPVTGNGNLLKINVVADNTTQPGDYTIKVKCRDDKPSNICNADGEAVSATFVDGKLTVTNEAHAHTLQYVAAKAATATEDGNSEYWYCTGCYKYFSDANGTTEITDPSTIVIPKTAQECAENAHVWHEDKRVEAQVRIEGAIEKHCTVCGKKVTEVLPALPSRKLGDVDGNGIINISDVTSLVRHVRKKALLDDESVAVSDVDHNNIVNISDVTKLVRFVRKKITSLA